MIEEGASRTRLEWAPDIPTAWDVVNLKMLARIFAGGTPDRKKADYWSDGTVPWLNSGSVNDWAISAPSELISQGALNNGATRWAPKGSVLVALAGQGKTKGMAARLEIDSTLNQSLAAIVPGPSIDYRFLQYWLTSNYLNIRGLAGGDLRDGLNLQHIGSIHVPRPPVEVQRAIADYLDRETMQIDAFIAKNEELITLLAERRTAVIADRIAGSAGRDRGEKLGYSCRLGNGSTPRREEPRYWDGGDFPWLNSSVVNLDRVGSSDQFVTDVARAECHLPTVQPGAIVVGLTGEGRTRGMATIVDIAATINQHLGFIQPDLRRWVPDYLLWLVRSRYAWLRDVSDANGATKGGLTVQQLRSIRVERPSLADQMRLAVEIESQTASISDAIDVAGRGVSLARERRAALISAAVTGKIDVGVAV